MTEYCPQCGAPLPENCLFCPSCGASCARPDAPAPQPPVPEEAAPAPEESAPAQEAAPSQEAAPAAQEATPEPAGGAVPPPPSPGPRYAAQPPHYAAQPPRYAAPAPAPAPARDKNEMTTGRYLACLILFAIPVVGLILMFVWGFGGGENVHRRRLARAALLFVALVLVLCILSSVIMAAVGALGYWLFPRRYGYRQDPFDYFEDFLDHYDDYYDDYYYDDPYGYYSGGNGYGGHHLGATVQ